MCRGSFLQLRGKGTFITDGYDDGRNIGVLIGFDDDGILKRSSGHGKWLIAYNHNLKDASQSGIKLLILEIQKVDEIPFHK